MSDLFAEIPSIMKALRILFFKSYRPTRHESDPYWNSKVRAGMGISLLSPALFSGVALGIGDGLRLRAKNGAGQVSGCQCSAKRMRTIYCGYRVQHGWGLCLT